jgi:hypothetical protein
MRPTSSYNTNLTTVGSATINDSKMQDTNLNLNLVGFLTQDGNIDTWRNFHQCL